MRVLVTGATGYIGGHVIPALLARGHSVVATSRDAEKAAKAPWFSQVEYVAHDLSAPSADCYALFGRPEALIHLSWEGLPHYKALYHFERNLWRSYRFLKLMLESGLRDCTVAGTCLEYGMRGGLLDEAMEVAPTTAYGLAKDTLRRFLQQLQREHDFALKWLRLFYSYGEGQSPRSLFSQLERALQEGNESFPMSGGEQLRDFLPADQMGEYIADLAVQDEVLGIINCCSGVPRSVRGVVEDYLAASGKEIALELGHYPYPDYEPMAFWGSTAKLSSVVAKD